MKYIDMERKEGEIQGQVIRGRNDGEYELTLNIANSDAQESYTLNVTFNKVAPDFAQNIPFLKSAFITCSIAAIKDIHDTLASGDSPHFAEDLDLIEEIAMLNKIHIRRGDTPTVWEATVTRCTL